MSTLADITPDDRTSIRNWCNRITDDRYIAQMHGIDEEQVREVRLSSARPRPVAVYGRQRREGEHDTAYPAFREDAARGSAMLLAAILKQRRAG